MNRADPRYREAVRLVRKDPLSQWCFVTGGEIPQGGGDPHHVLPVSLFPEHAYNTRNIVIVNREPHHILTIGDPQELSKLPRINNLLARMGELDYDYYKHFYEKLTPWMNLHNGWD